MLVLDSLIVIDDLENSQRLEFKIHTNVEIVKSRKTLTNTCKITIPRKLKGIDNLDINKKFLKRGLSVSVFLGYDNNLVKEFTGFISNVSLKIPVEITCQDGMWELKQNSFTKAFQAVTLKELVSFIYTGESRVADLQLGGFVIKQQSTAQVLEALKKYGLQSYFDSDGVLVVDFAGSLTGRPIEVLYDFGVNIIDDDLDYIRKEDLRLKVRGISKMPNGNKIETFMGDLDGDERTLNYFNIGRAELEKIVKHELDNLKKDGLKNTFTTFGIPYIEPGYVAILNDEKYPERNGSYLIESVTTQHGVNGFRRVITPERKLA